MELDRAGRDRPTESAATSGASPTPEDRLPLLIGVDGVLNVAAATAGEINALGLLRHATTHEDGTTRQLLIHPRAGEWLLTLTDAYELVWCTAWENANDVVSPLVGLPGTLRRVATLGAAAHPVNHGSWSPKVPCIRRWATDNGVERLAWLDAGIQPLDSRVLCTSFARERENIMSGSPALVDVLTLKVSPQRGLGWHHVEQLREWADG